MKSLARDGESDLLEMKFMGQLRILSPLTHLILSAEYFEENGQCFADHILKCILLFEKFHILFQMSLKIIPWGPVDNKSALFQAMAWQKTGDKPLFEPLMT